MGWLHWTLWGLGILVGVAFMIPGGPKIELGTPSLWFGLSIILFTNVVSLMIGQVNAKHGSETEGGGK